MSDNTWRPEERPEAQPEERPERPRTGGEAVTDPWAEPGIEEPRSGRHPVNVGQLVMGLAFLCFVGAWALVQSDVVTGDDIRWLLPIPWLVAGAVGLGAVAVSSARRHGVRR